MPTAVDKELSTKIWERLLRGKPLFGLPLTTKDGRYDVGGLVAAQPKVVREFQFAGVDLQNHSNVVTIRNVAWKGIDFSRSQLDSLCFDHAVIDDCVFEGAQCRNWRLWGTRVSNSTFRRADLRGATFGAKVIEGSNVFSHVDFTRTNLHDSTHRIARFEDCTFSNTNLLKVEFQGTVFERCVFEGKLDQVLFYRHAFRGESEPPNEMRQVSFRRAKFCSVGFRELDMQEVEWPVEGHILIEDLPATLDGLIRAFQARTDLGPQKLVAVLTDMRKWVGPRQQRSVVSVEDLVRMGGEPLVSDFKQALEALRPTVH